MFEKLMMEKQLIEKGISIAAKDVEIAKHRTTLSALEANFANNRVLSATLEAEAAEDVAEEAVGARSLNFVDVASRAVVTAQAAAVRARIACFETQLAEGRAVVWCNEATEAWSRVKADKKRLYNFIVESETGITRSVDEIDEGAIIVANNLLLSANDSWMKAYESFKATKRHVVDALDLAFEADQVLDRANLALAKARRVG